MLLAGLFPVAPYLSSAGQPTTDTALEVWPPQGWLEGDHLSQPADSTPANAAQDALVLFGHQDVLLTLVQLGVHQTSQVLLCKDLYL